MLLHLFCCLAMNNGAGIQVRVCSAKSNATLREQTSSLVVPPHLPLWAELCACGRLRQNQRQQEKDMFMISGINAKVSKASERIKACFFPRCPNTQSNELWYDRALTSSLASLVYLPLLLFCFLSSPPSLSPSPPLTIYGYIYIYISLSRSFFISLSLSHFFVLCLFFILFFLFLSLSLSLCHSLSLSLSPFIF